jgi:hypothetical protein
MGGPLTNHGSRDRAQDLGSFTSRHLDQLASYGAPGNEVSVASAKEGRLA